MRLVCRTQCLSFNNFSDLRIGLFSCGGPFTFRACTGHIRWILLAPLQLLSTMDTTKVYQDSWPKQSRPFVGSSKSLDLFLHGWRHSSFCHVRIGKTIVSTPFKLQLYYFTKMFISPLKTVFCKWNYILKLYFVIKK